ncbi:Hypothetical predicted protein [Prunus dulcis]|uniref:Uncharacterized protein n=1 Tax=Prunus dulcis TaxID=3755 RepID=A0A5E4FYR7_PRUDU|nr:hypothetical protein L3X38_023622 [Prunus dulcis]VVA32544.1 Hypothetical predicted protein [Prunus dulcis]
MLLCEEGCAKPLLFQQGEPGLFLWSPSVGLVWKRLEASPPPLKLEKAAPFRQEWGCDLGSSWNTWGSATWVFGEQDPASTGAGPLELKGGSGPRREYGQLGLWRDELGFGAGFEVVPSFKRASPASELGYIDFWQELGFEGGFGSLGLGFSMWEVQLGLLVR